MRYIFRQTLIIIAAALVAAAVFGHAKAQSKKDMVETLRATFILHRAADLCPQYKFTATKSFDYAGFMSGARVLLGEKAVKTIVNKANSEIGDMLMKGETSILCDMAESHDAALTEVQQ